MYLLEFIQKDLLYDKKVAGNIENLKKKHWQVGTLLMCVCVCYYFCVFCLKIREAMKFT